MPGCPCVTFEDRFGIAMSEHADQHGPKDAAAARRERLAQALRDNLKRRKAQSRGRAIEDRPVPDRHQD